MKLNVDLENHSYPIYIERNAIQKVHEYIPVSRKIAIITDTGVPEKWINIVKQQCPDSFICTIPQGEPSNVIPMAGPWLSPNNVQDIFVPKLFFIRSSF